MPVTSLICFCSISAQSRYRAFEDDLQSSLKDIRFCSKEFHQITARLAAKYCKGLEDEGSSYFFNFCLGPTPMRIAKFKLYEKNQDDETNGYDDVNIALWPSKSGTNVQFLDGWSESEGKDPSYLVGETYRNQNEMIRCGAATKRGNRSWPGARIYRLENGRWRLTANQEIQNPFGYSKFKRINLGVSPHEIISCTWDLPKHFSAPMSGPHLNYEQIWTIRNNRFHLGKVRLIENAMAELDRLIGFAVDGNCQAFNARVPSPVIKNLWRVLRIRPHVSRPTPDGRTFQLKRPMWEEVIATVTFEKHSGRWIPYHVSLHN